MTRQRFKDLTTSALRGDLNSSLPRRAETIAIAPLPTASGQRYRPPALAETALQARASLPDRCRVLAGRQLYR